MKKIIFIQLLLAVSLSAYCQTSSIHGDTIIGNKLKIKNLSAGLVKTSSIGNASTAVAGVDYVTPSGLNYFNVKDYGAKGDGTTDDSLAVRLARDAAQVLGGTIYFPLGNFKIGRNISITGAPQTDGFDNGGITIQGASQRGTKIHFVGGITGFTFGPSSKMMCHIRDIEIYGDGKTTANSRAIYWQNTGGSYTWENVYIHDFATGIEWYDHTLGSLINVNIRLCSKAIKGGWNQDIMNFMGCRFDYCDTAVYVGQISATHTTRNQEENCWNFIGCRISNNINIGIFLNDYGASGFKMQGSYFESNGKDLQVGFNGAGDAVGPVGITFDGCYFSPITNAPVAEGLSIYNPAIITFRDCKTVNSTAYTVFCKLYDETAQCIWQGNSITAATAAIISQGFNYNPLKDNLIITAGEVRRRDALVPGLSGAWHEDQMTGGTGKIWHSWTRRSGSDNSLLSEIRVQDVGGVGHIEGVTNAFIASTAVNSLPTASVNYRNAIATLTGNGSTTADTAYQCLISAAGTYSWKKIGYYQPLLTNPVTGTGTAGQVAVYSGSAAIGSSSAFTVSGGAAVLSTSMTVPKITMGTSISSTAWTTGGIKFISSPIRLTNTTSSGTVAAVYNNVIGGDTMFASSATTNTVAEGTHFVTPVAGTNVTNTTSYAAGFEGDINLIGGNRIIKASNGLTFSLTSGQAYAVSLSGSSKYSISSGGNHTFLSTSQSSGTTPFMTWTQSLNTGGACPGFLYTGGAHTSQTTATELNDWKLDFSNVLKMVDGTVATQRTVRILARTYTPQTSALTLTKASTLYVPAPVAGSGTTITTNAAIECDGNLLLPTVGNKLFIKTGTNASVGSVALVGGTVTVSNTSITTNTLILVSIDGVGTLANVGTPYEDKSSRIAGTSFTLKSTNVLDTSTITWMMIEPAP